MAGFFDDLISEYGKSAAGGKALPARDFEELNGAVRDTRAFDASLRQFRPDYAGNPLTGRVENWIQSVKSDFGTPGQRDWWAAQQASDNVIRNQLFGSALTGTEKAAWEETTVNPSMDPTEVQRNLMRRRATLQEGLKRRVAYLKANGYDPKVIDDVLGDTLKSAGFSVEEGAQQFPGLPSVQRLSRAADRMKPAAAAPQTQRKPMSPARPKTGVVDWNDL